MIGEQTREALRLSFIFFAVAFSMIAATLLLLTWAAGQVLSQETFSLWLALTLIAGTCYGMASLVSRLPQNISHSVHPASIRQYAQRYSNTLIHHTWPSGRYWESYGPGDDSMDPSLHVAPSGNSDDSSASPILTQSHSIETTAGNS